MQAVGSVLSTSYQNRDQESLLAHGGEWMDLAVQCLVLDITRPHATQGLRFAAQLRDGGGYCEDLVSHWEWGADLPFTPYYAQAVVWRRRVVSALLIHARVDQSENRIAMLLVDMVTLT